MFPYGIVHGWDTQGVGGRNVSRFARLGLLVKSPSPWYPVGPCSNRIFRVSTPDQVYPESRNHLPKGGLFRGEQGKPCGLAKYKPFLGMYWVCRRPREERTLGPGFGIRLIPVSEPCSLYFYVQVDSALTDVPFNPKGGDGIGDLLQETSDFAFISCLQEHEDVVDVSCVHVDV